MHARSTARPARVRDAAALVGSLALVIAAAGVVLGALDALPHVLAGEHKGITRYQSIEGAERSLGARVFLPSFFPDSLRWPPDAIRVYAGPPAAVALAFSGRDGTPDRLVLYQALGPRASVPMALMPAGRVLQEAEVAMPEGVARLVRLQFPDGVVGNDLIWYRPEETLALRYAGPAEQLLTIARSLRRRRP